ncbi:hypothetical protein BURKHO8Y_240169 [Burkholderia sp. 8Y]|nr:hypothetical protein BURKHO8Y_240169 [Burkholderia sp. 8Y]
MATPALALPACMQRFGVTRHSMRGRTPLETDIGCSDNVRLVALAAYQQIVRRGIPF